MIAFKNGNYGDDSVRPIVGEKLSEKNRDVVVRIHGLKGDEIPLGARLFMVADVYDALTSERPYRSPVSYVEAAAEIRSLSGSHFDPLVVDTFMAIAPEQLQEIAGRYQDAGQSDMLTG